MMNNSKNKIKKYRQSKLNKGLFKNLIINLIIIFIIITILFNVTGTSENNKIEDETSTTIHESITQVDNQDIVVSSANVSDNDITYPIHKKWNPDETHLLAMIAMAEAEGESLNTKVLIILTVLNRLYSDEFPNTIREVIFEQNEDGVYQFTCIEDGRWENMGAPTNECWEAIQVISGLDKDISNGALYFESCEGETWHSENLTLTCVSDNTRFYR